MVSHSDTIKPERAKMEQRIVIITAYFAKNSNYIETVFADRLSEAFDVHIVSSSNPIPNIPLAEDQAISQAPQLKIYRLNPLLTLRGRVIALGLKDLLDEIKPDLIIQMSPSQLFSLPATSWARRRKIPIVYISGENSEQLPARLIARWVAEIYNRTVRKRLVAYATRSATRVFAITPETKTMLEKSNRDIQPTLLNLPVDKGIFNFSPSKRASERTFQGWTGHVTLFSGKFEERKNLRELAQGWLHSVGRLPGSRLVLVGLTGAQSESRLLEDLSELSQSIELRDFVTPDELSRLLQAADLGVFPTPTIGIQQAMATGLPVVLSETSAVGHLTSMGPKAGVHVFETWGTGESAMSYIVPGQAFAVLSDQLRVQRSRNSSESLHLILDAIDNLL